MIYNVSGTTKALPDTLLLPPVELQQGSWRGKKGYCPAWLQLRDECKGDGQGSEQLLGSPMLPDICGASVHVCVATQSTFPYLSLLIL